MEVAGRPGQLHRATGQVKTFTYQEAVAVNDKVASDPTYRDRLYQAWREAASRKYQQVKTLLNQYIQQNTQQTTTTTTAAAKADLTYVAAALAAILAVVVIFLVLKRR